MKEEFEDTKGVFRIRKKLGNTNLTRNRVHTQVIRKSSQFLFLLWYSSKVISWKLCLT